MPFLLFKSPPSEGGHNASSELTSVLEQKKSLGYILRISRVGVQKLRCVKKKNAIKMMVLCCRVVYERGLKRYMVVVRMRRNGGRMKLIVQMRDGRAGDIFSKANRV